MKNIFIKSKIPSRQIQNINNNQDRINRNIYHNMGSNLSKHNNKIMDHNISELKE